LPVDRVLTVREDRLFGRRPLAAGLEMLRMWAQLFRMRFDRVLIVHADRRYRLLVLPTWPAATASLSHDPRRPNPLPSRFRGDEYARLLDNSASSGPILDRYELADLRAVVKPAATRSTRACVALVPGGARNSLRDDALRRWPVERFRELARLLVAEEVDVILLGDASDAELRTHFAGMPVTDCLGSHTLTQLLEVMRAVDVVVAVDTGPLHLARLVRTPVVALFGPTDARQMVGEASPGVHVHSGGAHLPCRPCYDGKNYAACTDNLCMQSIAVDAVFQTVLGVIRKQSPSVDGSRRTSAKTLTGHNFG
jgi:heptosyltransferase-2